MISLKLNCCLLLLALGLVSTVPVQDVPTKDTTTFIGRGTENLASSFLNNYDTPESAVFSPLGFNTLFAIFAEGARGQSRQEIAHALHFPKNVDEVRNGYKLLLTKLSKHSSPNLPELKNWFYVYKNYSVNNEFKDILKEFYLTDIKAVERQQPTFDVDKTNKKKLPVNLQGKPTDHLIDVDKDVGTIIENSQSPHKSDSEEAISNNGVALFDSTKDKNLNKHVTPEIESTTLEVTTERETPETTTTTFVRTDQNSENEVIKEQQKLEKQEEENKDVEVMVAMHRSINDAYIDDIKGSSKSSMKKTEENSYGTSQVVVFNGLYFKGNWATPLTKYPADDSRPFYKSNGEKVITSTLGAGGLFRTAEFPEINARAIELPYEEGKYSLLIIVPHSRDGIHKLMSDIKDCPIHKIVSKLQEKSLEICLPVFSLTTIGKGITASSPKLANITEIFDSKTADFSGISNETSLFVDELVQIVTFKVDSKTAVTNFLSASIISSRSDLEKFEVNQPFLFYLRDNTDGVVVVNGHICDPTARNDEFRANPWPLLYSSVQ